MEPLERLVAPLTTTDVDVPPECQGVITFVNTASFAVLDEYLPSDCAMNVIGSRPHSTIAGLSSVNTVGPVRLTQIHRGAQLEGYITSSCVGIYDELAVSSDDQARMLTFVNGSSDSELHSIMPDAWNGATNLLNLRPFTSAMQVSNVSGIGPVSFRSIRNNSTLSVPFETLATAVNNLHRDARLLRHFDWWEELQNALYSWGQGSGTCFGVNPDWLPSHVTIRSNLANATEVYNEVSSTVSFANRYGGLPVDPAIGLANLQQQIQGKSFFGCYISYSNDPWSGNSLAFFVDTATGYSVLSETWWSE